MLRAIKDIVIGDRCRKEMGDIAGLANSIDAVGLMHPVVIDKADNLIAGERRIRACQLLGWKKIPVTVIDLAEIVRGEYHENAIREPFQPTEVFAIYKVVGPLEIEAAKKRMSEGGKGVKVIQPSRTTAKIGKFAGVSSMQLHKIIAIMEAAIAEPERFGDLPAIHEQDRFSSAFRIVNAGDDRSDAGCKPYIATWRQMVARTTAWTHGRIARK
jgi:hypothetical protein